MKARAVKLCSKPFFDSDSKTVSGNDECAGQDGKTAGIVGLLLTIGFEDWKNPSTPPRDILSNSNVSGASAPVARVIRLLLFDAAGKKFGVSTQ